MIAGYAVLEIATCSDQGCTKDVGDDVNENNLTKNHHWPEVIARCLLFCTFYNSFEAVII